MSDVRPRRSWACCRHRSRLLVRCRCRVRGAASVGSGQHCYRVFGAKDAQIEDLFSHLEIIAPALALAGGLTFHCRRFIQAESRRIEGGISGTQRSSGWPDWRRARSLSPVQRLFPLRCDHLRGHVGGSSQGPSRSIQLRPCGRSDLRRVVAREAIRLVRAQSIGGNGQCALFLRAQPPWSRLGISGRPGGIEMAQPLAGGWTLVPLWRLLYDRGRCCTGPARPWLLRFWMVLFAIRLIRPSAVHWSISPPLGGALKSGVA